MEMYIFRLNGNEVYALLLRNVAYNTYLFRLLGDFGPFNADETIMVDFDSLDAWRPRLIERSA